MRRISELMVLAVSIFTLAGCGGADLEGADVDDVDDDSVEVGESLRWRPGSDLVNVHFNWHTQPCGRNGGRRCTNQGADFLDFHHNFLGRLRAAGQAQGLSGANMAAWGTIPQGIQSQLPAAARTFLGRMNGSRATFCGGQNYNQFGSAVESQIHAALHNAAARRARCAAGSTAGDCIVQTFMSPASTIFFQIHGRVDRWRARFDRDCR